MEPTPIVAPTGLTIVAFLFVLTVVVFFHELGHLLVARWRGVKAQVFSVGFGPELLGFTDRTGTRWRLSAIPLGGYVRFVGDDNEAGGVDHAALDRLSPGDRAHAFASKPVGSRAAIIAAGPIANFLLAIVIFTAIFSIFGKQEMTARVDAVTPGSVAEQAGFLPGDVVQSVNGEAITDFTDLQRAVSVSADRELTIVVRRADREVTLTATPQLRETKDIFGNAVRDGKLGIVRNTGADQVTTKRYTVFGAFVESLRETWFVIARTGGFVAELFQGRASLDQLGGPVTVAKISGQVATLGFIPLLSLAAVLSISIGLINLLPIPILDGGHLLFCAFEAARGRPVSETVQEVSFRFGFLAILSLMLFTVFRDTRDWWPSLWAFIT